MKPITPQRVFGFIFFQRYYSAVKKDIGEKLNLLFEMECAKLITKEFQVFKEAFAKMTPEETKGFANAVKMWNGQEKEKAMKRLMSDEVRKKAFIDAKLASGDIKEEGIMGDLHATYFDALHMYEFLANVITKDIQDITIMSTWEDYRRLFEKPKYEGDFLTQMFDWNLNQEQSELEEAELKKAIVHLEVADDESWESFSDEIQSVKYKTKHAVKKWKKEIIRSKIEEFKTQSFRPT